MKRSDDRFAQRLRDAGASVTPATSETLHERVIGSVRRQRAAAASSVSAGEGPVAQRGRWPIGAAAAAVGVAVGVGVWLNTPPEPIVTPTGPPVQVAELPPVPSLEAVVVEQIEPVRVKLHEARFAYLDRDTKRLARFLIRAVPGVPAEVEEAEERL